MPRWKPEPVLTPPEPVFEARHGVILVSVLIIVFVPLILVVRFRFKRWKSNAYRKAFQDVDHDKSGSIDCEELYACVLSIYLTLNQYGLYVVAPDRKVVDALLKEVDSRGNKSGQLDYDEFAEVMQTITAGALTRCTTTVLLTAVCPSIAAFIVTFEAPISVDAFPIWLQTSAQFVPAGFTETILTTLLLMLRPFFQDLLSGFVHKALRHKPPVKLD